LIVARSSTPSPGTVAHIHTVFQVSFLSYPALRTMSRGTDVYDPEALSHLRPSSSSPSYWLDELGHSCPKTVDYGTQCPKGHDLVAFSGRGLGGEVSAHGLMCRTCHSQTEQEHASSWLVCSRAGCCATYAVCERCVGELVQPRSENIGDGFGNDFPRLVIALEYMITHAAHAELCRGSPCHICAG
jgi:hypothetical protein